MVPKKQVGQRCRRILPIAANRGRNTRIGANAIGGHDYKKEADSLYLNNLAQAGSSGVVIQGNDLQDASLYFWRPLKNLRFWTVHASSVKNEDIHYQILEWMSSFLTLFDSIALHFLLCNFQNTL
jgi:hypothetical protein